MVEDGVAAPESSVDQELKSVLLQIRTAGTPLSVKQLQVGVTVNEVEPASSTLSRKLQHGVAVGRLGRGRAGNRHVYTVPEAAAAYFTRRPDASPSGSVPPPACRVRPAVTAALAGVARRRAAVIAYPTPAPGWSPRIIRKWAGDGHTSPPV